MYLGRLEKRKEWKLRKKGLRLLLQAWWFSFIKLVLWHLPQPLLYLWMLYVYRCYIASLGEWQQHFATVVAVREVLYLCSTVLAAWQCPVFLLMDPVTAWLEAKGRLERLRRAMMWFLTPHTYTALCLAYRFPDKRRTFLGLVLIQVRCNSAWTPSLLRQLLDRTGVQGKTRCRT
eukprot:COSAG02_NODE_1194_length_13955_cov_7.341055_8_plen_175_part_00